MLHADLMYSGGSRSVFPSAAGAACVAAFVCVAFCGGVWVAGVERGAAAAPDSRCVFFSSMRRYFLLVWSLLY